jgi:lysophospholipase L1-like esterase
VQNPSVITKLIFLLVLFSGFFVPYFLNLLKIKLTNTHYLIFTILLCLGYFFASWCYYSREMDSDRLEAFHSFLQIQPTVPEVAIPKPAGMFRILCLGGSTTEGFENGSYPQFLQDLLQYRYPDKSIEVVNGGHFFYNTEHAIIEYLFLLKDIDPDLIIFFEAVNDLMTSFTMPPFSSHPFRKDYGHFVGVLGNIIYPRTFEKFLAGFFYADLLRPRLQPIAFSDFKSQNSFRRNLETLIEITRCKGIPLLLSNQAHCHSKEDAEHKNSLQWRINFLVDNKHYADEKSWYVGMELFNSISKATAEKNSIPFVDQASVLNGRQELFKDPYHLTREGERLRAELFYNKIIELRMIK